MDIELHGRVTRWRQAEADRRAANATANLSRQPPFPGRWVSAIGLTCGPALLMAGILLRAQFHYFFPDQLAAYTRHPALITAAYACFACGIILLCPAVMTLAQRIAATSPLWGLWGGCLVIVGLFTRTFQFGTDHLAFHLTDSLGLSSMINGIGDYYSAWRDVRWHPSSPQADSAPRSSPWASPCYAAAPRRADAPCSGSSSSSDGSSSARPSGPLWHRSPGAEDSPAPREAPPWPSGDLGTQPGTERSSISAAMTRVQLSQEPAERAPSIAAYGFQ
ncbi:hypothetical protein ACIBQX_46740 [Nonomuraea sp. NPDC049714]|uniref:hypothetical protein n=1 Tax=Nonomuraea sp. NPDC049714 TaxID=3364357 RepID=UPI0037BB960D